MENIQNTQGTQYKRTSRHPSEETKELISQSLRGRPKDESWRQAISAGMVQYWGNDDNFPDDAQKNDNGVTGMTDIVL